MVMPAILKGINGTKFSKLLVFLVFRRKKACCMPFSFSSVRHVIRNFEYGNVSIKSFSAEITAVAHTASSSIFFEATKTHRSTHDKSWLESLFSFVI